MRRRLQDSFGWAAGLSLITSSLLLLPAAAAEPDEQAAYEITVYGEGALRQARWDTILALKKLGWEPIERGTGTRFKPPRRWMGKATLLDDGSLLFRYPVVKPKKVEAQSTNTETEQNPHFQQSPGGMALVDNSTNTAVYTLPVGEAGLWLLPSHRVLDSHYDKVREQVRPQLQSMARVQRDTRVHEMLDRLPDRFDALWADGVALDGTGVLPQPERIDHLLGYWGAQPNDFEGDQITRAAEAWMRAEIANDILPPQRERAEALRSDHRTLSRVISEKSPASPDSGASEP